MWQTTSSASNFNNSSPVPPIFSPDTSLSNPGRVYPRPRCRLAPIVSLEGYPYPPINALHSPALDLTVFNSCPHFSWRTMASAWAELPPTALDPNHQKRYFSTAPLILICGANVASSIASFARITGLCFHYHSLDNTKNQNPPKSATLQGLDL